MDPVFSDGWGGIACILPIICKKINYTVHFIALSICSAFIMVYQIFMGYNVIKQQGLNLISCEFFYDSIFDIIWVLLIVTFFLRMPLKSAAVRFIKVTQPLTLGVYIVHPLVNSFFGRFVTVNSLIGSIGRFAIVSVSSFIMVFIISKMPFGKYFIRM